MVHLNFLNLAGKMAGGDIYFNVLVQTFAIYKTLQAHCTFKWFLYDMSICNLSLHTKYKSKPFPANFTIKLFIHAMNIGNVCSFQKM